MQETRLTRLKALESKLSRFKALHIRQFVLASTCPARTQNAFHVKKQKLATSYRRSCMYKALQITRPPNRITKSSSKLSWTDSFRMQSLPALLCTWCIKMPPMSWIQVQIEEIKHSCDMLWLWKREEIKPFRVFLHSGLWMKHLWAHLWNDIWSILELVSAQ